MNKYSWLVVIVGLLLGATAVQAQTDMTQVVSTVSGYWDAVKIVAIGIILFVLGRRVLKKL